ncbi:bifunctional protein [includes: biotin operon repressor; biotin-[acetyl-CoA-carboxylase]synthetase] [Escherichia coli]|uniref:Bifunctional protein [includes: biotin operon repressor biotin-[acetyl-CoA-carboxylase]synthetase] n=1 Tax=Escherichia coli TaxID=562 RepID=A0A484Y983_ECOLX|nr:bifunctional protein [includes: biotin operon repressor; biotin-[acetyl-CoA-carboxylase]synthetase] [Escherichia coli]
MKDNTVPLKLIALLANGEFHSGEQLGETLGMSRAAINKHIQTLRDWGVDVFTVPGKGYSLPEPIQLLNAEKILSQLDDGSVAVLPVIDSTNQYLLDRIGELKSGDACVAEYQHAGRGRRGRKWFSPFGANFIFVDVLASGTGPGGGDWFKSGYRYRDGGSITQAGCR